ncbi:MAG: hypothetical protein ACM3II_09815, partial [Rhodospirillaceae bacterium]
MYVKAAAIREPVEIASPGGNMVAAMLIAQDFKKRGIPVRVTGWCASGCAMIAIGSGRCTVARSGHLVLHGPAITPGGIGVTDYARALDKARTSWKDWMDKAGVPADLIEATLQAQGQKLELSDYAMKRVGCTLE